MNQPEFPPPIDPNDPVIQWLKQELDRRDNSLEEEKQAMNRRSVKNKKKLRKIGLIVGLGLIASALELAGTLSQETFSSWGFQGDKLQIWFHWSSAGLLSFIAILFGGNVGQSLADLINLDEND